MRAALAALTLGLAMTVAGIVLLPRLLPPDQIESLAVARLERVLDVQLASVRQVEVSLFPTPKVRLDAAVIDHAMAHISVERAAIDLRPAPLLLGRIVPDALTLDGFVISGRQGALAQLATLLPVRIEGRGGEVRLPALGTAAVATLSVAGETPDDRALVLDGRWRQRPLRLEASFAAAQASLERLDLTLGDDRVSFVGRADASGADGRVEVRAKDLRALRAVLPPLLPLPPLLDALLADHDGALGLDAALTADHRGWRLDELAMETPAGTATGSLAFVGGRLEALLKTETLSLPVWRLREVLALVETTPGLLAEIERVALDAKTLRLRLNRATGGLETSLRLNLAGETSVALEGRVELSPVAFAGTLNVVSADAAAILPPDLDLPWTAPLPTALEGTLRAEPGRAVLSAMRLTTPALVFEGGMALARDSLPALAVDGTVDRLRLPQPETDAAAMRRLIDQLWASADLGGVEVDLDLRRVELGALGSADGRLIATLAQDGLWVTALELEGRDIGVSMTGGLRRSPLAVDGIGAARLLAPARLRDALVPDIGLGPVGLGVGHADFSFSGPLERTVLDVEARVDDLALSLSGAADLVAPSWSDVRLDVRHPNAATLLRTLGATPPPGRGLHGPVVGAMRRLAGDEGRIWTGRLQASALAAEIEAGPDSVRIKGLEGPTPELASLLQAFDLWPDQVERWRRRHQGDWPRRPRLLQVWPTPIRVEAVADGLVDAAGRPIAADLALDVSADRLVIEHFAWVEPERTVRLTGVAEAGERGVAAALEIALDDSLTSPLPRALGLGWLGRGRAKLEASLEAKGATPAELAASLRGRMVVDAASERRAVRARDGSVLLLPAFRLAGEIAVADGRGRLDELGGEVIALTGEVDLYRALVAATLNYDDVATAEARRATVAGRLDTPSWSHSTPARSSGGALDGAVGP